MVLKTVKITTQIILILIILWILRIRGWYREVSRSRFCRRILHRVREAMEELQGRLEFSRVLEVGYLSFSRALEVGYLDVTSLVRVGREWAASRMREDAEEAAFLRGGYFGVLHTRVMSGGRTLLSVARDEGPGVRAEMSVGVLGGGGVMHFGVGMRWRI
jgi:hypothetical protein